jgi:hypothetical protein
MSLKTHASINVFCMAKEEYHQRNMHNLMKFLKFPPVSILVAEDSRK